MIDGSIGERSPFHETFGYYAHGVGPETATLSARWRERAGVVRPGPDPSDIAVSKLAAWREKDREFVATLLRHQITTAEAIEQRLQELEPEIAARIRPRLRSVAR